MKTFEVGKVILEEKIAGENWTFYITNVFHLPKEEYTKNQEHNNTLGNYEPEKELPKNSVVTITATNQNRGSIELKWSSELNKVLPQIRKRGWTKSLFSKLNVELSKWSFPKTNGV